MIQLGAVLRKLGSRSASRFCGISRRTSGSPVPGGRHDEDDDDWAFSNDYTTRTHNCGQLRLRHVGQSVKLCGWLRHKRFPKFLVIDDVYGAVQIYNDSKDERLLDMLRHLNLESVLAVEGVVAKRPVKDVNAAMPGGDVEVRLRNLTVSNPAKHPLPVEVNDFGSPTHLSRLKYRYLDLRRAPMQKMLRFRAELISKMRRFLESRHFVEVETPTLFRRTPGGAREFVVPSSSEPGRFYSLPQSPQQFKQLLMVAGLDRYFQLARCYRDEGAKADRQPEFTQLDLELSFADQPRVMRLVEHVIEASWPRQLADRYSAPVFDRMTYRRAMDEYGTDKPDLRFDWRIERRADGSPPGGGVEFYLTVPDPDGCIDAETLAAWRQKLSVQYKFHADHFAHYRRDGVADAGADSSRFFATDQATDRRPDRPQHDTVFVIGVADADSVAATDGALKTLGLLRIWAADRLESAPAPRQIRHDRMAFVWITDFPLFLPRADGGGWESAHHPFTAPQGLGDQVGGDGDLEALRRADPARLLGQHYDLVLNGAELGGGSVRIHDPARQRHVLEEILGEDCDQMRHLLEAFEYGAPPHAGFALGLDRYVSQLLKTDSIRDVIAFPKTTDGRDLMTGAPTQVSQEILDVYHIKLTTTPKVEEKPEEDERDSRLDASQQLPVSLKNV